MYKVMIAVNINRNISTIEETLNIKADKTMLSTIRMPFKKYRYERGNFGFCRIINIIFFNRIGDI
jgi:hypothetical protein